MTGFGFVIPFLPYYIQELGTTDPEAIRFWTGAVSAAPALTMAVMAPIWGLIADRIGKKIMLLRAMLVGAIIMVLVSMVQTVEAVFVLRLLQGLFTGTMTASAALVATGTPTDRQSSALGFLAASNFVGISLGPFLGGVAAEVFGYRSSFLFGAVSLGVGFFLVLFLIKDPAVTDGDARRDRRGEAVAGEGAAARGDAAVDGGAAGLAGDAPSGRRTNPGAPGPPAVTPSATGGWRERLRAVALGPILGILVLVLMVRFSRVIAIPFLPLFVQELRGTLEGAPTIVGSLSAGRGLATAFASVVLGRLGDKHDRNKLLPLFLALAAAAAVPLFFTRSLTSLIVLLVVGAFFLGGVEPLLQSSLSAMVPPNRRGLVFGVITTVGNLGWFVAPLVGSAVAIRFEVRHVFATMAMAIALTVIPAMLVRRRYGRA